ncbi:MAG: FtsX-like permease family protein [Hyphomicrobiaceae bacterium]|nr:FtsX-like permease family protein [Hyphomicrobiaceae bacterium]MCC0024591.1 FtsX-like permease family protein [Hyphomicrobiaceae bacterium]
MTRFLRWARVGLKDMRGDLSRFGLIVACLILGTGTIAMVGTVGSGLKAAIVRDTTVLIGGDMEIDREDRALTADELSTLKSFGSVAEMIDTVARASADQTSALIDLVAVSENYPLLGGVRSPQLAKGQKPAAQLGEQNGTYGALVDPLLLDKLGIGPGQSFSIGGTHLQVRGTLESLPDGAARGFQLGLAVLISSDAFASLDDFHTPLPGLLTSYRYKILLHGMSFQDAKAQIPAWLSDSNIKIRSPQDAAGTLARYSDLFSRYLLIVGLASLLVGGVGVSIGVSSYLAERQKTMAIMRTLGSTGSRIVVHFMAQIGALALFGVGAGMLIGALAAWLVMPVIGTTIGVQLNAGIAVEPLLTAGAFGMLASFAFSYPPLLRAKATSPALLFRTMGSAAARPGRLTPRGVVPFFPVLAAIAGMLVLAIGVTQDPILVLLFALGAVASVLVLQTGGWLLQRGLRPAAGLPWTSLRIALRSIFAPGSPAPVVVVSIGLGLSVLLLIALLADNLRSQLLGSVSSAAPTAILTDLFPDEVAATGEFASGNPDVEHTLFAPLLRGKILSVGGIDPRHNAKLAEEAEFMLERDIPMSWRAGEPEDGQIVEGSWWPSDYDGPPLISMRASIGSQLGAHVGDHVEIRIFGDVLDAKIANFRDFDYQQGINPFVIFSPGAIETFPATFLGTIKAVPGHESALMQSLTSAFPDIGVIPVGDALEEAAGLVGELGAAINAVGAIAVLNGLLVLAGTLAAGRKQREADAVVRKVLGATRRDILTVFALEYGLIGAFAAAIASLIGGVAALAITRAVLNLDFTASPLLIVFVVAGAMLTTITTGMLMTWNALSRSPAQALRGM